METCDRCGKKFNPGLRPKWIKRPGTKPPRYDAVCVDCEEETS